MPPKKKSKGQKGPKPQDGPEKPLIPVCRDYPGPKYKLKALVGYKDHCLSKYRNPAYSLGLRVGFSHKHYSPGPTYDLPPDKKRGFSFGMPWRDLAKPCSPGPYSIPSPKKTPAFSIKFRTEFRPNCGTPGPYYIKSVVPPPAYSMGLPLKHKVCRGMPGPQNPGNLNAIKPRAPGFTIGDRVYGVSPFPTPGPKYLPRIIECTPKYSFGVKHTECSTPYITECDDRC